MKRGKWKSVKLEGAILNENISDLIGIEELTDYDLETIRGEKENLVKPAKTSKKRQLPAPSKDEIPKKKKPKIEPVKIPLNPNPSKKADKPKKVAKKKQKVKDNIEVGTKTIQNKIPVDDLVAWSNFGLPDEIMLALAEQGFTKPTEIQQLTLHPALLGRRDILGAAETGSGKTLAFGIPIVAGILDLKRKQVDISQLDNDSGMEEYFSDSGEELEWQDDALSLDPTPKKDDSPKPLYALILTPTRELAVQIKNHLTAITKYTDIRVAVVLGGMAAVKQERILQKCPEIVVATPGRLWELIQEGNSHLSKVDNIRYLAIDETDRMVERGHFMELHPLLERINENPERKKLRQNFVFSATLTLVHDLPKHLQTRKKLGKGKSILKLTPGQKIQKLIDLVGMTTPKIVDITKASGTASLLTECRITCPTLEEKDYYLYYFLKRHPGRTLIFCNSIGCVKRLTTLFGILECEPLPLHASMQQRQRLKNLERFRDNPEAILIATDVAARGLDIPQVQHVIHYQVPRTAENYIHRSGRTARASAEGITVLIMEPTEFRNYIRICHTLGKNEDLPLFPVTDAMLAAVKQRVNLARDIDKLELSAKRTHSETGWFQKAIEEMDIIVDDRDRPHLDDESESKSKKEMNIKRKQLQGLLKKALFPKGFSYKYPSVNETLSREGDAISVMKAACENYAKSGNKVGTVVQRLKKKPHEIKREKKIEKQKRKDAKKKQKKKMREKEDERRQMEED